MCHLGSELERRVRRILILRHERVLLAPDEAESKRLVGGNDELGEVGLAGDGEGKVWKERRKKQTSTLTPSRTRKRTRKLT